MMNILAQIVGFSGILILALAPQQKTKKKVLIFQTFASILYALQYILLSAFSAAATNIIGLIKNLVFYGYTKNNKNIPIWALGIYSVIIIGAGVLTFNNVLSVFPIVLSLLDAYGVWQNNLKLYRKIAILEAIAWIIYNFAVGAYVSALGSAFQFFSVMIAIWRLDIKQNNA